MQEQIIVGNLTRDQRDQLMVDLTLAYTNPVTGKVIVLPGGVVIVDTPTPHWTYPADSASHEKASAAHGQCLRGYGNG